MKNIFYSIWIGILCIVLLFQVFNLGVQITSHADKEDLETYKQSLIEKPDLITIDGSVYEIKAEKIK